MMTQPETFEHAVQALVRRGTDEYEARRMLNSLISAGFGVAQGARDELVCRWVDVADRAVPPDADTIIRTITRTHGTQASSTTHWLEGLRAPLIADAPLTVRP